MRRGGIDSINRAWVLLDTTLRRLARSLGGNTRHREGVLFAVTDAVTADAFLRPHLEAAGHRGQRTFLIAARSERLLKVASETGASPVPLDLSRSPDPMRDAVALVRAVVAVLRAFPIASHVGTPKAGLIIGLATFLTRVPTRMYTVHGLRFETESGWRRRLLVALERIACAAATQVVAVSDSVAKELIRLNVASASKVKVLGSGSISGVDLAKFSQNPNEGKHLRRLHSVPLDRRLVLFVGRLSEDKGILELGKSWVIVSEQFEDCHLMIVGELDESQPARPDVIQALSGQHNVSIVGAMANPGPAYSAADLLVLPTYREGFATVVIEAGAAGIPTIASDVTGCKDSVVDGRTGLLVTPRDSQALAAATLTLLRDDDLRRRLGAAARARVQANFEVQKVVDRYMLELGI